MNPQPVRERVLKVATEQFAAIGYEATTMRSVASRAGVTLPTVYHYFGDKANLYFEACVACFAPRAERGLDAFRRSTGRHEERVLEFFVDLARDFLEDDNLFKLMQREMIEQDREGIRRLTERCWKQSFTALCNAFRVLLPKGEDPAITSFTSFTLLFGMVECRRLTPFLHPGLTRHYSPESLALVVLNTTVPSIPWREFCPAKPAAALA